VAFGDNCIAKMSKDSSFWQCDVCADILAVLQREGANDSGVLYSYPTTRVRCMHVGMA